MTFYVGSSGRSHDSKILWLPTAEFVTCFGGTGEFHMMARLDGVQVCLALLLIAQSSFFLPLKCVHTSETCLREEKETKQHYFA